MSSAMDTSSDGAPTTTPAPASSPDDSTNLISAARAEADDMNRLNALTTAWRFEAWIHTYPLNRETVLDYFKHSEFYDRSCNNEVLLMQHHVDHSKLTKMTGIEYEVDSHSTNHSYYIIHKQYRTQKPIPGVTILSSYYVVGVEPTTTMDPPMGTVFPLPDMHSVFRCNLTTGLYYLSEAFREMREAVRVTPSGNYIWDFTEQEKASSATLPPIDYASAKRNAFSDVVDEVLNITMKWEPEKKSDDIKPTIVQQPTPASTATSAPVATPTPIPPTPSTGF